MNGDVEFPPFRPIDDFLLGSARFSCPTFTDPIRWTNRIIDNMLYYQANYLLFMIVMFLIIGCLYPAPMLIGLLVMALVFTGFVYATNNRRELIQMKQNHPMLSVLLILAAVYFCMYVYGGVLVFMMGILFPIAIIFIHASMRMRNLKNKMGKKLESLGLKRTPMGMLLFELGLEEQARS
ncbi:PRA1 family protein 3-like [Anneissia japonica]|uniref:PRA1 family protein 3-like n=1 Tax=Anneissia japonica TaxID=1529436 RepID=UPI001425B11A|nr:PRA1 family protein 3-like [Anneissia japonica]